MKPFLLALGLTSFLMFRFYATSGTPSDIPALPDLKLPVIYGIPFVGAVIGDQNIVVWLSILAVTGAGVLRLVERRVNRAERPRHRLWRRLIPTRGTVAAAVGSVAVFASLWVATA